MRRYGRIVIVFGLLAGIVLSTVLSGCGAVNTAKQIADVAKELATQAPNVAKELQTQVPKQLGATPTNAPISRTGATPTGATTQLEDSFNNLLKLAPLHLSSAFVSKKGETVQTSLSYEADLDAAGNQHMKLVSAGDAPLEIYIVDGQMYVATEEGQFMAFGEVNKEAGFGFLTLYGGGYLLAFNDLQNAKLVGSEKVSGFQANKYQINMDLGTFGLVALAGDAQLEYQGFAWVESTKSALVKALVDWSGKDAKTGVTESNHSEFLATKGTITEIKAPEATAARPDIKQMGERGVLQGLAVTLEAVELTDGPEDGAAGEGATYVLARITLENTGLEQVEVSPEQFWFIDQAGEMYDDLYNGPSAWDEINDDVLASEYLAPGSKLENRILLIRLENALTPGLHLQFSVDGEENIEWDLGL